MQIDRLFQIIYILLHKKSVTAKELAEEFEVSQRTIYRAVDMLSAAGIPIYTARGKGGGIRLMDGFVLDRSLLSDQEKVEILSSLQSMRAMDMSETNDDAVLDKLYTLFQKPVRDWIMVDYSDWANVHRERFTIIKEAIFSRQVVRFHYMKRSGGRDQRDVEPLQLWFKHRNWYLYAFCRLRQDYRLFKLSRMVGLVLLDECFPEKEFPPYSVGENADIPYCLVEIFLKIDASQGYRIQDEMAEENYTVDENGNFLISVVWSLDEWVYGTILSYGPSAEVLKPQWLREEIMKRLDAAREKYK